MKLLNRWRRIWLRLRYRAALRDLAWMQYHSQQCIEAQRAHLRRLRIWLQRLENDSDNEQRRGAPVCRGDDRRAS